MIFPCAALWLAFFPPHCAGMILIWNKKKTIKRWDQNPSTELNVLSYVNDPEQAVKGQVWTLAPSSGEILDYIQPSATLLFVCFIYLFRFSKTPMLPVFLPSNIGYFLHRLININVHLKQYKPLLRFNWSSKTGEEKQRKHTNKYILAKHENKWHTLNIYYVPRKWLPVPLGFSFVFMRSFKIFLKTVSESVWW